MSGWWWFGSWAVGLRQLAHVSWAMGRAGPACATIPCCALWSRAVFVLCCTVPTMHVAQGHWHPPNVNPLHIAPPPPQKHFF